MIRLCLTSSFLLLLLFPEISFAAPRYAVATGNWNSTATWSATSGGAPGASVPGILDDVIFVNGPVTVTVTADAICNSVHIENAAAAGNNLLFINNGVTLTVMGNTEIEGFHVGTTSQDARLTIDGGTLTVGGNLVISCHNNQQMVLDLSNGTNASSVINIAGDFTNSATNKGKFLPGTNSTINFNGTSPQVIHVSGVLKTYANIAINNAAGVTLTADMSATELTGNLRVQSGILYNGGFAITATGGTFEVANGAKFVLTGTSAFPSGLTTVLGATGTVDYAGTTQTIAANNYGNLTVSAGASSRTVTLASSGTIGVFTTFSPSATNNTYTITGSTVAFNGNLAQTLPATFATYNNLIVNNASGITLGANTTVNGALTFTSGTVTTGSNTLYIPSGATVSRTSGHVIGDFKKFIATGATSKTFEVGHAGNYTPVSVSFASVTTAGDLTARTTAGDHPNVGSSTLNGLKSVNRYWTLTNSGIGFTTYSATFNFVAGDLDAGVSTAALLVGRFASGTWTYPTVGTRTATSTQATGLAAFGDFQIAEAGAPSLALGHSVTPSGTRPPGTDLTYTLTFTNAGASPAQSVVIVDSLPANTDFKVGSVTSSLGSTGLTVAVAYSNNGGSTWTYTPASGAGGAPVGYDRNVTHVRWTFTGSLSPTPPNNAGSLGSTARIR
jgi:uncharacterized repeat protein (TIGR01451 family)